MRTRGINPYCDNWRMPGDPEVIMMMAHAYCTQLATILTSEVTILRWSEVEPTSISRLPINSWDELDYPQQLWWSTSNLVTDITIHHQHPIQSSATSIWSRDPPKHLYHYSNTSRHQYYTRFTLASSWRPKLAVPVVSAVTIAHWPKRSCAAEKVRDILSYPILSYMHYQLLTNGI